MNDQPDTTNVVFPEKDHKKWVTILDDDYVEKLALNNECDADQVASAMVMSLQLNR